MLRTAKNTRRRADTAKSAKKVASAEEVSFCVNSTIPRVRAAPMQTPRNVKGVDGEVVLKLVNSWSKTTCIFTRLGTNCAVTGETGETGSII